ncbi:hypothetical protein LH452_12365 [Laribacter hongkongensis]|uniref:hypothetical protein n=1 Tax=Laribacter hongkongensis TaxID=168471 RepID=UPI001EFE682C|nr:hypothetical protein [Laribacter hongkongensis]MCG9053590.1 hypothetical protein [Laribacter hongkongensis]MCG9059714.1 hypothetical protein [Laribacter hongkongensis]MCG9086675.1 hypothetical protein [Laribacter hongkongensis]
MVQLPSEINALGNAVFMLESAINAERWDDVPVAVGKCVAAERAIIEVRERLLVSMPGWRPRLEDLILRYHVAQTLVARRRDELGCELSVDRHVARLSRAYGF